MKLICNFLFLLFFNYMRLDKFLTKTKIFQSRNRVLEEIKADNIKINGKIVKKGGFDIKDKYLKKGNIAILKDVTLYYLFDFGDQWVFQINKTRHKDKAPEPGATYPRVVESKGKNPIQYPDWKE